MNLKRLSTKDIENNGDSGVYALNNTGGSDSLKSTDVFNNHLSENLMLNKIDEYRDAR